MPSQNEFCIGTSDTSGLTNIGVGTYNLAQRFYPVTTAEQGNPQLDCFECSFFLNAYHTSNFYLYESFDSSGVACMKISITGNTSSVWQNFNLYVVAVSIRLTSGEILNMTGGFQIPAGEWHHLVIRQEPIGSQEYWTVRCGRLGRTIAGAATTADTFPYTGSFMRTEVFGTLSQGFLPIRSGRSERVYMGIGGQILSSTVHNSIPGGIANVRFRGNASGSSATDIEIEDQKDQLLNAFAETGAVVDTDLRHAWRLNEVTTNAAAYEDLGNDASSGVFTIYSGGSGFNSYPHSIASTETGTGTSAASMSAVAVGSVVTEQSAPNTLGASVTADTPIVVAPITSTLGTAGVVTGGAVKDSPAGNIPTMVSSASFQVQAVASAETTTTWSTVASELLDEFEEVTDTLGLTDSVDVVTGTGGLSVFDATDEVTGLITSSPEVTSALILDDTAAEDGTTAQPASSTALTFVTASNRVVADGTVTEAPTVSAASVGVRTVPTVPSDTLTTAADATVVVVPGADYATLVESYNVFGYYKFAEVGGTDLIDSGTAGNGSYFNDFLLQQPGIASEFAAALTTSSAAFIPTTVTPVNPSQEYSVFIWFNSNSAGSANQLLVSRGNNLTLGINASNEFQATRRIASDSSIITISAGTWSASTDYFLGVTFSFEEGFKLWLNGSVIAEDTDVRVGAVSGGNITLIGSGSYTGIVDELTFFDYTLSPAQIGAMDDAGRGIVPADVVDEFVSVTDLVTGSVTTEQSVTEAATVTDSTSAPVALSAETAELITTASASATKTTGGTSESLTIVSSPATFAYTASGVADLPAVVTDIAVGDEEFLPTGLNLVIVDSTAEATTRFASPSSSTLEMSDSGEALRVVTGSALNFHLIFNVSPSSAVTSGDGSDTMVVDDEIFGSVPFSEPSTAALTMNQVATVLTRDVSSTSSSTFVIPSVTATIDVQGVTETSLVVDTVSASGAATFEPAGSLITYEQTASALLTDVDSQTANLLVADQASLSFTAVGTPSSLLVTEAIATEQRFVTGEVSHSLIIETPPFGAATIQVEAQPGLLIPDLIVDSGNVTTQISLSEFAVVPSGEATSIVVGDVDPQNMLIVDEPTGSAVIQESVFAGAVMFLGTGIIGDTVIANGESSNQLITSDLAVGESIVGGAAENGMVIDQGAIELKPKVTDHMLITADPTTTTVVADGTSENLMLTSDQALGGATIQESPSHLIVDEPIVVGSVIIVESPSSSMTIVESLNGSEAAAPVEHAMIVDTISDYDSIEPASGSSSTFVVPQAIGSVVTSGDATQPALIVSELAGGGEVQVGERTDMLLVNEATASAVIGESVTLDIPDTTEALGGNVTAAEATDPMLINAEEAGFGVGLTTGHDALVIPEAETATFYFVSAENSSVVLDEAGEGVFTPASSSSNMLIVSDTASFSTVSRSVVEPLVIDGDQAIGASTIQDSASNTIATVSTAAPGTADLESTENSMSINVGDQFRNLVESYNPINYLRMDDSTPVAARNYDGEIIGSFVGNFNLNHPGLIPGGNTSVQFLSGYIQPNSTSSFYYGTSDFTLGFWYQPQQFVSAWSIFDRAQALTIYQSNDDLAIQLIKVSSSVALSVGNFLVDSTTRFIVLTYSTTEGAKVYVDGALATSNSDISPLNDKPDEVSYIGRFKTFTTFYADSTMDEFFMLPTFLTAEEVLELYTTGLTNTDSSGATARVLANGESDQFLVFDDTPTNTTTFPVDVPPSLLTFDSIVGVNEQQFEVVTSDLVFNNVTPILFILRPESTQTNMLIPDDPQIATVQFDAQAPSLITATDTASATIATSGEAFNVLLTNSETGVNSEFEVIGFQDVPISTSLDLLATMHKLIVSDYAVENQGVTVEINGAYGVTEAGIAVEIFAGYLVEGPPVHKLLPADYGVKYETSQSILAEYGVSIVESVSIPAAYQVQNEVSLGYAAVPAAYGVIDCCELAIKAYKQLIEHRRKQADG